MNFEKKAALKLKYQALWWLRCRQRCPFIATEVGPFAADVMGINEKKIVEVEVKVTRQDMINDFKKYKHDLYAGRSYSNYQTQWIPNQFYFAVPGELVESAKIILQQAKAEKYGLIQLEGFTVIKRATKIHAREPNSHVKFTCALRMGSELIRFHEAWI